MLTLLLGATLAYMRVGAMPLSADPATISSAVHTAVSGIHARCDCSGSGADGRTLYDIVKGCLVTIAACVYRAVHQNIPDPELSFWGRLRVTMKVTFYALIVPELMIWWAMRQWFGSRWAVGLMNRTEPRLNWTKVHGQFAQMGGFARKDNKQVLHPYALCRLLQDGLLDVKELQLTEKEIQDKSKGDILSKTLVAFQTTWFMFECIARLQQGLPLLELEVVTLAFATLNIITYGLWWYKPLNVLCPIYIHVHPKTPDPPVEPKSPQEAIIGEAETTNKEPSGEGFREMLKRPVRRIVAVIKKDIKAHGWWRMLWKQLIKQPFLAVVWPLKELLDDEQVRDDATHVSTFFAEWILDSNENNLIQALSSFIGMIFGAIHFLSWRSTFPTQVELLLWRMSSIILVVPPFFMLLRAIFNRIYLAAPSGSRRERIARFLYPFFEKVTFFLGPIPYILARVCVLVLAFLTLHNPPSGAFTNISWTSYIPHL
ncbi:hypothetical protein BDN72DRAFT_92550 [Pluteus cervinus]|uniref:Uncharacterized protein n=1 Tax=Pluteus cervinus TaxID=181527 RepID=A0ACD2ZXW7_9AGAR|nr:hypothetical protein BDN72DRAFT_92550 [Pluteus cervinus]